MGFEVWTKNTVLTCLAHNDNVLMLRFAHPGTIIFGETITFSHLDGPVNTIMLDGDGGCAVFKPTWNPLKPTDYRTFNFGYFMEKLATASRDVFTWHSDDKIADFNDLDEEDYSADEHEYLRSVANNDEYDSGEIVAMMEYQYSSVDSDVVEDAVRLGRRYSSSMHLYYQLLCAVSKLGERPWQLQTGESIKIGNPDEWHW